MRKKIFIIISFLIILFIVFLLFYPYRIELKEETKITSSLLKVSDQLTDLRNWRHWHPALMNKDTASALYSDLTNTVNSFVRLGDHHFIITSTKANGIGVQEEINGKRYYQYIIAFPDTLKTVTLVKWVKAVTLREWVKEKVFHQKQMKTGLSNLKKIIENPDLFYGFSITIVHHLTDTLILTKNMTVERSKISLCVRQIEAELNQFIRANRIGRAPYLFEAFTNINNEKTNVSVGIPVTKKAPEKNGIKFLEMPSSGRVVRGNYQGAYSGLKELYIQLDRYMEDKLLTLAALPWEKYDQIPLSHDDSLHVKVEVNYPIY